MQYLTEWMGHIVIQIDNTLNVQYNNITSFFAIFEWQNVGYSYEIYML